MIEPMEKVPDPNCGVCLRDPSTDPADGGCICPECRICGVVGDPKCWTDHFPAAPKAEEGKAEPRPGTADLEEIRWALSQSLSQWKMYAEEREDEDLDTAKHMEGRFYQQAKAVLADLEKTVAAQAPTAQSAPPKAGPTSHPVDHSTPCGCGHIMADHSHGKGSCNCCQCSKFQPPALEPPAPRPRTHSLGVLESINYAMGVIEMTADALKAPASEGGQPDSPVLPQLYHAYNSLKAARDFPDLAGTAPEAQAGEAP